MSRFTTFIGFVGMCLPIALAAADSVATALRATRPAAADKVPNQPAKVPTGASKEWLLGMWKKYGQWDYKQRGFAYREFTLFNFGATGRAVGLDLDSLNDLARLARPTADDVKALDDPQLLISFYSNIDSLYQLHAMAEQDVHLVRIAPDYTWLDSSSEWPRQDIGLEAVRWNEYRAIFERIQLQEGILRTDDFPAAIFFIAHAKGLCIGGSSSGFVYSSTALTPTTQVPGKDLDTDARANPKRHYAYVFQPLKTNWYAFYEIDW